MKNFMVINLTTSIKGKIIKSQKLPNFTHEEIYNLNSPIFNKDITFVVFVVKNLSTEKVPIPFDFTGKFY